MDEPLIAVTGERRNNSGDIIEATDAWHIGSNTKMMTALTYATLVQRGDAKWGATLSELFPHLAETMHPDWQTVTIEDLLAHRSGMAPNIGRMAMIASAFDERDLAIQRAALAATTLAKPPSGTKSVFAYSNLGYMIAGAAIEAQGQRQHSGAATPPFETIFPKTFAADLNKLGGKVGFGPPQNGIQGHLKAMFGSKLKPAGADETKDNPRVFGPAGTMHVDLRTHALFLAKHFIAGDDAIKTKLLTPYPDADSEYALGWGVAEMDGIGQVFGHSGSNTMWLSNVTYAPSLDAIVIVNVNQFNTDARNAVRDLSRDILNDLAAKAPN
jgi:CubicO group peptidase (beta-lactamase class C family)